MRKTRVTMSGIKRFKYKWKKVVQEPTYALKPSWENKLCAWQARNGIGICRHYRQERRFRSICSTRGEKCVIVPAQRLKCLKMNALGENDVCFSLLYNEAIPTSTEISCLMESLIKDIWVKRKMCPKEAGFWDAHSATRPGDQDSLNKGCVWELVTSRFICYSLVCPGGAWRLPFSSSRIRLSLCNHFDVNKVFVVDN